MHEIVDDLEKGFLVASTVMYFVGVVVGLVVVIENVCGLLEAVGDLRVVGEAWCSRMLTGLSTLVPGSRLKRCPSTA